MVYLYAWERSENFIFLKDFKHIGVAYFALHIELYDNHIVTTRRTTGLVIPQTIKSFPVIRVDMKSEDPKKYTVALQMIADLCHRNQEHSCQVDFDFKESQAVFYKKFIRELSLLLNKDVKLSVTALPFRCYSGHFYDDLPVSTVVPLLIDVGNDETIISRNTKKNIFLGEKCQSAIGVATYQRDYPSRYFTSKEIYLFSNKSWTKESLNSMLKKYSP